MCWHDNRLHGIGFVDDFEPHEHEVRFDIDYIFKWAEHGSETEPSGFWIAPSTLVFPTSSLNVALDAQTLLPLGANHEVPTLRIDQS
jgi:hypothetical protein